MRLRFVEREGAPAPAMFAYATYFILVYGLLCWLVGRRIPLLEARFRCAAPPAAHEYRLMFCDQMSFDQAESYVDLAPAFLELPVIQTTKSVKPFLRDAPGSFIVKYRNAGSLAARVRKTLRALPMAGWPAADQMAARLHVAEATMRRRLKQEGYTYQSIKDDLRRDIAIGELQGSRAHDRRHRRPHSALRSRARFIARFASGPACGRPTTGRRVRISRIARNRTKL